MPFDIESHATFLWFHHFCSLVFSKAAFNLLREAQQDLYFNLVLFNFGVNGIFIAQLYFSLGPSS